MLKPATCMVLVSGLFQPPSGGCVLKQTGFKVLQAAETPAAFGRLCVETDLVLYCLALTGNQPPSGGCVLKQRG